MRGSDRTRLTYDSILTQEIVDYTRDSLRSQLERCTVCIPLAFRRQQYAVYGYNVTCSMKVEVKLSSQYDARACVATSYCEPVNRDAGRRDARIDSSSISASLALRPCNQSDFSKKARESAKGVV